MGVLSFLVARTFRTDPYMLVHGGHCGATEHTQYESKSVF